MLQVAHQVFDVLRRAEFPTSVRLHNSYQLRATLVIIMRAMYPAQGEPCSSQNRIQFLKANMLGVLFQLRQAFLKALHGYFCGNL